MGEWQVELYEHGNVRAAQYRTLFEHLRDQMWRPEAPEVKPTTEFSADFPAKLEICEDAVSTLEEQATA
eukprot:GSA25T00000400001.1